VFHHLACDTGQNAPRSTMFPSSLISKACSYPPYRVATPGRPPQLSS